MFFCFSCFPSNSLSSVDHWNASTVPALLSFGSRGLRAAVAVSCPLAYPAHQAELEKRRSVNLSRLRDPGLGKARRSDVDVQEHEELQAFRTEGIWQMDESTLLDFVPGGLRFSEPRNTSVSCWNTSLRKVPQFLDGPALEGGEVESMLRGSAATPEVPVSAKHQSPSNQDTLPEPTWKWMAPPVCSGFHGLPFGVILHVTMLVPGSVRPIRLPLAHSTTSFTGRAPAVSFGSSRSESRSPSSGPTVRCRRRAGGKPENSHPLESTLLGPFQ